MGRGVALLAAAPGSGGLVGVFLARGGGGCNRCKGPSGCKRCCKCIVGAEDAV